MSHDHHHHDAAHGHTHDHDHDQGRRHEPAAPETPLDPGSQALAEALKSSFGIVKVVMVLLVIVFLSSGFFTVGPQERAIKLRLGRPVGEGQDALLGPGPHFAFPYPIDEVVKVPFTEVQRITSTVGWYYVTPEQEVAGIEPQPNMSLNPLAEGYVLTADRNIIHLRFVLNYRIEDPIRYVFGFAGTTNSPFNGASASNLVLNALNGAVVEAAGQFDVDDILTRDVFGFKDTVRRLVTERLAEHRLGVVVEQLDFDKKSPPLILKPDFARVSDAAQKRDDLMSAARAYQNQTLSKAGAQAAALTNAAESDRTWYVEGLKAEASRFNDLLPKYLQNPELFVQLRLTETMGRMMTNVQDKIYLTEDAEELRLLLNREPQKLKAGGDQSK